MKTVQQYLRELDTRKLVDAYLEKDPIDYEKPRYKYDLTVRIIRKYARKRIREYINRLRNLTVTTPKEYGMHVLFIHDIIVDHKYGDMQTDLIHLDELLEKGPEESEIWAYEFNDQSEIVGYYVADTKTNREHIYELIADVMFEAAFFGLNQESLAKEKRVLDNAMKEVEVIKNGELNYTKIEDTDFYRDYMAKKNPKEEELRRGVMDANYAFNHYFIIKEINAVIESCRKQGAIT